MCCKAKFSPWKWELPNSPYGIEYGHKCRKPDIGIIWPNSVLIKYGMIKRYTRYCDQYCTYVQ